MKKQAVNAIIERTAVLYGFKAEPATGGIMQPVYEPENYIGFTVLPRMNFDESEVKDGKVVSAVTEIEVKASIRGMGGDPTPDDLLKAADAIKRGAELAKELQGMKLRYTEHYDR